MATGLEMLSRKLDNYTPGKTIKLKGVAPDKGGMIVNICPTDNPKDNVLFHFNPRYDEGCVVRNSMFDGTWGGKEEREGGMVFTPGQIFTITIILRKDHFQVLVDDKEFCQYNHRREVPNSVLLALSYGLEYS